ncbi:hypothetical protein [Metabacillus litoralis]|uniref:hypothetical protein n=1 Tax=Metabacillus litoralis TaxID=152268 RepID=UPI001CFCE949|nr:hypothetical protein [Metabacillus litoralis]
MKYLLIIVLFFSLTACNNVDQGEGGNTSGEGLLQTGNDHANSNDEMLVEAREEGNLNNNDPLHPTEAEKLVKEKLGIKNNNDLIVQYDHLENGKYIIHVYSINNSKENSEQWYMVDLDTNNVEQLKQ